MDAVLFYINRWLGSKRIAVMDAHEERGYFRLLLHAADSEDCGLPNNPDQLAVWSKLGSQWNRPTKEKELRIGNMTSGQKILECFVERDGRLYNDVLRESARWGRYCEHSENIRSERLSAARKLGRHKPTEFQEMAAFFDFRCVKCGNDGPLVKDHIVPLAVEGSTDGIENLQPLCVGCNSAKGTRERKDYRLLHSRAHEMPIDWLRPVNVREM